MHGLVYVYVFPSAVYREDLEAMIDTPVTVNSSNTQILASKYHTPIKGAKPP